MQGANMLNRSLWSLATICLVLTPGILLADAQSAATGAARAAALQGTSTTGIQKGKPGCPITSADFGPIAAGKVPEMCVYKQGANLSEFCGACLCSMYSVAADSLGSKLLPMYNATAADVYATLFGPHPQMFYDSGLRQCDPLVVDVLTEAGAFPPASWQGVDICMSLSASQELLDLSRSSQACELGKNINLEVAASHSSSSISAGARSVQLWLLPVAAAGLLLQLLA